MMVFIPCTCTAYLKRQLLILIVPLVLQALSCVALKPLIISATPSSTPPLLDVPTYSMATCDANGTTNMNVLTYATPVCARPDRVWALGLYKGTLSYENFLVTKSCVLQLMTEQHVPLVKLLGGSSGNEVDKQNGCESLGFAWGKLPGGEQSASLDPLVLPGCAYYLKLTAMGDLVDCGCHCAALCKVECMYVNNEETQTSYVSTARLRELGIITEQGRVAE
jgi:flavin reductase (DIM6/NTAB) family NADH-FMN oxidoreductase RutF